MRLLTDIPYFAACAVKVDKGVRIEMRKYQQPLYPEGFGRRSIPKIAARAAFLSVQIDMLYQSAEYDGDRWQIWVLAPSIYAAP